MERRDAPAVNHRAQRAAHGLGRVVRGRRHLEDAQTPTHERHHVGEGAAGVDPDDGAQDSGLALAEALSALGSDLASPVGSAFFSPPSLPPPLAAPLRA